MGIIRIRGKIDRVHPPSSISPDLSLESIVEQLRVHPKLIIADDYEIAIQSSRNRASRFTNGEIAHRAQGELYWISLRLIHRKQPGRAVVSQCTKSSLQWLVETAFESAKRSSVDPWFRFPIWKPLPGQPLSIPHDGEYETQFASFAEPPEWFEEVYDVWDVQTLLRRKSERFVLRNARQVHAASFSLISRAAGDLVKLREERAFARPLSEIEEWLRAIEHRAGSQVRAVDFKKLNGKRSNSTRSSLLFAPGPASTLVKRLSGWLYADLAQSGMGPLAGRAGQQVVSPSLTLVDHGSLADGSQSCPFDLEGVPTQQTAIFEKGVMKNFLYDFYSATKENRLSTGNFLRSTQASHPRIGSSNLYFMPGTKSNQAMLKEMDHGFWIENLAGIDSVPGEETKFSMNASGWRVAQGRCVEPVRNIPVAVDLLDFMSQVVGAGTDLEHFGSYGSPSILFDEIPLG